VPDDAVKSVVRVRDIDATGGSPRDGGGAVPPDMVVRDNFLQLVREKRLTDGLWCIVMHQINNFDKRNLMSDLEMLQIGLAASLSLP
jgi:hypothetical protein